MKQIAQFLQRLKDKNNSILLIFIFLILAGCAANMVKMYEGPEKPLGEIAIVEDTRHLSITKIDGKKLGYVKSIVVNPGPHILSIDFHKGDYYTSSDKPIVRGVNLLPGKTYLVKSGEIEKWGGQFAFVPVYVEDTITGENVSFQSKEIHEAAEIGDIDAVKLNLEVNSEQINIKKNGWAPLHYAARYGHKDVAALLIAKGAQVNNTNQYFWTPLHFAARYGFKEVSELLIENGAEINAKQEDGWTPLHFASRYDHKAVVKLIVTKGAQVNNTNKYFWAPLHYAAKYGFKEVSELLIENGAEINAKQENGWTPLHFSARGGHNEIAELLISKGAEVNEMDNRSHTPLYWAVKQGHNDVADILRKHGGMGTK